MGLDAMPAEAPHAQPPTPPLPLRRSRSASSAEGSPRPSPWDAPQEQQQPRVVRASASLREKPAYLRQESDEFLLLSFSPEGHRGRDVREELEFLLAAAEPTGCGERGPDRAPKHRRNGYCRKLLFGDDEAESSSGRRRRMPAGECDAQNSSPVSVLEVRDAQEEESTTTTTSSSLEEVDHAEPCSATSGPPTSLPRLHCLFRCCTLRDNLRSHNLAILATSHFPIQERSNLHLIYVPHQNLSKRERKKQHIRIAVHFQQSVNNIVFFRFMG